MSFIEFHGVNKLFGDLQVLKDIDFTVDEVVIGPSGKSTLSRPINAPEEITSGELIVDAMHLIDKKTAARRI